MRVYMYTLCISSMKSFVYFHLHIVVLLSLILCPFNSACRLCCMLFLLTLNIYFLSDLIFCYLMLVPGSL